MLTKVLSLDDDPVLQVELTRYLSSSMDIEICKESTEALQRLKNSNFDVILLDKHLKLEGISGIDLIPMLKNQFPWMAIIILSYDDDFSGIKKAYAYGADDFILKSSSMIAHLQIRIPEALRRIRSTHYLDLQQTQDEFQDCPLLGQSAALMNALKRVEEMEKKPSLPALLVAEQKSGALTLARKMWEARKDCYRPFQVLDLLKVAPHDVEALLFGKASVNAKGERSVVRGFLQMCFRGDLVIHDLTSLPLDLQKRLAECLRAGVVVLPEADYSVAIDVRLIGIELLNVGEVAVAGMFSAPALLPSSVDSGLESRAWDPDLYALLSENKVLLPPLRQRSRDIAQIVDYYLERQFEGKRYTLSADAAHFMQDQVWPGNFQQVRGVIDATLAMRGFPLLCQLDMLDFVQANVTHTVAPSCPVELPFPKKITKISRESYDACMTNIDRHYIVSAVNLCDGDLKKVSELMGFSITGLYHKLAQLKINLKEVKKIRSRARLKKVNQREFILDFS